MKEATVALVNELERENYCLVIKLNGVCVFVFVLFIDALPPGILAGPNVCDKEEIQTELIKVTNNELVEVSEKKWCWKLMNFRCVETKQEMKPVEKLQQLTKNRVVLTCCNGFEKNYNGNRCIPVQQLEEYQQEEYQQVIQ